MKLNRSRIGVGLRSPHYDDYFAMRPALALVELHSENHFAPGGPARELARQVAACAPLSLHGVGLSLGSADGLDARHLDQLAALVGETKPWLVSEHIAWSRLGDVHSHDLLPLPYCPQTLRLLAERIDAVQQRLGRELLVENISSYVQPAGTAMPEWEFVAELVERANCALLLDVNNVYVNSCNHGFAPEAYFAALPWSRVRELHVAGHQQEGALLIDTHSRPVAAPVRDLLASALTRCAPDVPVLLEWDADLPDFAGLLAQAWSLAGTTQESLDQEQLVQEQLDVMA